MAMRYCADRMYGAAAMFSAEALRGSSSQFLRQQPPQVLRTSTPQPLLVDVGNFSGPPQLGPQ